MKIAVVGRCQSGKTTTISFLQEKFPHLSFVEVVDPSLADYFISNTIIYVETPAFLCFGNAKASGFIDPTISFTTFYEKALKRQELYLSYVQELNNVFFVKNNKDLANLKVQVNKLKIS